MRRFASACLLLWFVSGVMVAGEYDFATERSRVYSYLASEHATLGNEYAKLGLNRDARFHYDRARVLVPDHPEAMKGLGYKRQDGKWVFDRGLAENDAILDVHKRAEARKAPDKKRGAFYEKARERTRELAVNAADAGQVENAALAWAELLYYDAFDKEANEKLGRSKDERGNFLGAALIRAREAGKKLLKEGSEGKADGEDEQGEAIGAKLYRRKGGPIVARSTESDKRAAKLHRICDATVTLCHELLGITEPLINEKNPYTVTSVQEEKQYVAMVEQFSGKSGEGLKHSLKLNGTATKTPWGYVSLEGKGDLAVATTDDMLAHLTASMVLTKHRVESSPAWVSVAFTYFVTGRVLGTTRAVRYSMTKAETTSARPDDSPDRVVDDAKTPQGLRVYVLRTLRENRDISLFSLAPKSLNDLGVEQAATAFSWLEFMFERYPESTRRWLKERAAREQAELLIIERVFGKTIKELQVEWRAWVLCNY
ncbi:MAG: hypothetical protein IT462_14090 [Planctomycetes bacterium]|nr:hypothetical protein [Planctomycetota bacterium]